MEMVDAAQGVIPSPGGDGLALASGLPFGQCQHEVEPDEMEMADVAQGVTPSPGGDGLALTGG